MTMIANRSMAFRAAKPSGNFPIWLHPKRGFQLPCRGAFPLRVPVGFQRNAVGLPYEQLEPGSLKGIRPELLDPSGLTARPTSSRWGILAARKP